MPDSLPPLTWGPPLDERDLDALLSGDIADTPVPLRQVAEALTALRAAPTQTELSGEAAARAEFRAFAESLPLELDEAGRTGGNPYAEVLSALALGAGRPTARHRIIRSTQGGPARPDGLARRHRAGAPGRRIGRRGAVLMAAGAAAALIVAVFVVTGSLPGPIHPLGHSSAAGTQSAGHSSASPAGTQNLQVGSATPEPSHKPAPAPSVRATPSSSPASPPRTPRDLCRTYYRYFLPTQPHGTWSAELDLFWKIANLAGSPFRVTSYCTPYVKDMFPRGVPASQDGQLGPQGSSAGGNQGNGQNSPGNNGPAQSQQTNPPA
jgi:hypothetical protein